MARTIFDAAARQQLLDRLARLRPDSARRFGKMTPNQMMCHLEDAVKCATGATPVRQRKSFMSSRLMRWLIIYVIPWPKGKVQTVREMQLTLPGDFEADRQRLAAVLTEASTRGPQAHWAPHPAFGDLTGPDYGTLLYRHCDFHFKQFGI